MLLPLLSLALAAADHKVDPTFLRRSLAGAQPVESPLASASCTYYGVFGQGTLHPGIARSVARFGKVAVAGGGKCAAAAFAGEEQNWFVLKGEGVVEHEGGKVSLRPDDFVYLPVGKRFTLSATRPLELVMMGFRVPEAKKGGAEVQSANAGDVKKQVVGNHPPSTLYQLLIGDTSSKRDRIAAGAVVTSLFIMDIAPGGTNLPHHHDREDEVYLLLEGEGEMVAGGGMDGVEGRFLSKAGDAYLYRLNTTVGFYNTSNKPARILAVRSLDPFAR